MVLCPEVRLDTLPVRRSTSVDIFSGFVATDKGDGLDCGFIEDEVDSFG